MFFPLVWLGLACIAFGISILLWHRIRITGRTRVEGTVHAIEEAANVGLADATYRVIIRYQDSSGSNASCSSQARALVPYVIGDRVPVYLSTTTKNPPIIGGFREAGLWAMMSISAGILCIAIAQNT